MSRRVAQVVFVLIVAALLYVAWTTTMSTTVDLPWDGIEGHRSRVLMLILWATVWTICILGSIAAVAYALIYTYNAGFGDNDDTKEA